MVSQSAAILAILAASAPIASCGLFKPEMPVKMTYRPSLVGEGLVLQLHNESSERLVLEVSFEGVGPGADESAKKTVSVGPNAVKEVGWLEGVLLQPGATIVARHERYKPRTFELPAVIEGYERPTATAQPDG